MNELLKFSHSVNFNQIEQKEQVDSQVYSHLLNLKVLYSSNSSLHSIKQAIWSSMPKLPVQYQRSILQYCQNGNSTTDLRVANIHVGIGVWLQAARMFKGLDCKSNLQRKAKQFQMFLQDDNKIKARQKNIIRYNLACLYEIIGQNKKADNIMIKFIQRQQLRAKSKQDSTNNARIKYALQQMCAVLKARLYLKSSAKQNRQKQAICQLQERNLSRANQTILRFCILTQVPFKWNNVTKVSYLKLFEVYNLGLVLKQSRKFQLALKFFFFVLLQSSHPSKISLLCKINIAQCQFLIGLRKQAIKNLQKLESEDTLSFISSYKMEISEKIKQWSQTDKIIDQAKQYGANFQQQVFNSLTNNQKRATNSKNNSSSKNLLNNKKLLFLEERENQLQKIRSKNVSNQGKSIILGHHNKNHSQLPQCLHPYYSKSTKGRTKGRNLTVRSKRNSIKNQDSNKYKYKTIKNPNLLMVPSNSNYTTKMISINSKVSIKKHKTRKGSSMIPSHISTPSINSQLTNLNSVVEVKKDEEDQNFSQLINHLWAMIKISQDDQQIGEKYLLLGNAYTKQGDFQSAVAVYKKALEKGKMEAHGCLANLYYNNCKFQLAIQSFEKYLANTPYPNNQQKLKLMHCYTKFPHHLQQACQKLKKFLEENPNDLQAHLLFVTVLMKLKNYSKAIQLCERFKIGRYLCHENHHMLGMLYKLAESPKQAFQAFLAALKIDPCSVASLIQVTQLTDVPQFLPELVQMYRKSLSQNTESHELLQVLYQLLSNSQFKFDIIKPSLNFSQLITIGDFFIYKQMLCEAEIAYTEAAKYTNNTLIKQKLGNLEYMKNNFAVAQQYYKQSQKRRPMFKLQIKLSDTLLKQNKFEQAQQKIQQCITRQKQNKSICYNMLGQCMFGLGNYEKALQNFQISTKLSQNKKINMAWERACRRKIMEKMKDQRLANCK